MEVININGINVEIKRKNIKNMYLRVYSPDARVHISVPKKTSNSVIQDFLISKLDWINKHVQIVLKRSKDKENINYKYVSDELHCYFGNPYKLLVIEDNLLRKVELQDDKIVIYAPLGAEVEKRAELLYSWYATELKKKLISLVEIWERKLEVKVSRIKIRKMKTLWGSCNFRSKQITFNLELCKRSEKSIEYIVVHELAHLIEPSHNAKFKAILDFYLPNWRDIKKELNQNLL